MSGGRWDYAQSRIRMGLEDAGGDEEARDRWPETTGLLEALADSVFEAVHGMDYALSGDTDPDGLIDSEMAERIRASIRPPEATNLYRLELLRGECPPGQVRAMVVRAESPEHARKLAYNRPRFTSHDVAWLYPEQSEVVLIQVDGKPAVVITEHALGAPYDDETCEVCGREAP